MIFKVYSREERRMHVHIISGSKSAKCWLEPQIEIAENNGFKKHEISDILKTVEKYEHDFKNKWEQHFG